MIVFDCLLLVAAFIAVFIAGIIAALNTLQKEAPDLYTEYERRRKAKEGKE